MYYICLEKQWKQYFEKEIDLTLSKKELYTLFLFWVFFFFVFFVFFLFPITETECKFLNPKNPKKKNKPKNVIKVKKKKNKTKQKPKKTPKKNPKKFKMETRMIKTKENIHAWKEWATPRRIFYITILVLLFISLILFIIAVSITSSAQGNLSMTTPQAFNVTAQYIAAPAQIRQGSIMLSSDYSTIMLFTDDLYLIDFNLKKVLWQANSNAAGSLIQINSLTGIVSYGYLQFLSRGTLYIVDGSGTIRWTNHFQEEKKMDPTNPFVFVSSINQQLQIQYLNDYIAGNYSNYVWNVTKSTIPVETTFSTLLGPFRYLANSFTLQSPNKMFLCQLNNKGILEIYGINPTTILWQSTFNSNLSTQETTLYSLILTCTGNLSILNQCNQTVWSSQTTFPYSDSFSLHLDNVGHLIILTENTTEQNQQQEQVWSSNDPPFSLTNPPLSWYAPLAPTTDFNMIAANQESKLQLSNGDLFLFTTNPFQSPINISKTGNKAFQAQITLNGTFQLVDRNGKVIYEILSGLSDTCSASFFTYLISNEQFVGYTNDSNSIALCIKNSLLFVRPYLVPNGVPVSITGGSNLAIRIFLSLQIPSMYFLLSFSNLICLVFDTKAGTINVIDAQSGEIIGLQNTFFTTNSTIQFYFKPNGLFLLQTNGGVAGNNNISLWNSGTAQPKTNLNINTLLTQVDNFGRWTLFCNSQINIILNPNPDIVSNRNMWSITSITTITREVERSDPSQTQNFKKWRLLSFIGIYYLTFTEDGYLAIYKVSTDGLLWKSSQQGNLLLFDSQGILNLITESNISIQLLVPLPSSNPDDYPYSLCLSDHPSILIINSQGDIMATLEIL